MNLLDILKSIASNKMVLISFSGIAMTCCCISLLTTQQDRNSASNVLSPTEDINLIYTQAFETAKAQIYLNQTSTVVAFPTPTITVTSTIAITPTQTLVWDQIKNASCIPNNLSEQGTVTEVVDGDTIKVLLNEKIYSVRYIGVDTPEKNKDYYSLEALLKNEELVFGKVITLVKDVSETDQYGRLLRYILADDVFVNYELVEKGYAVSAEYPPDTSCQQVLKEAQQNAAISLLGIWQAPTVAPIIINTPCNSLGENCSPSYPGVCIPPAPPDLDCKDVPYKRFTVLSPDPHGFDRDRDGIGCES